MNKISTTVYYAHDSTWIEQIYPFVSGKGGMIVGGDLLLGVVKTMPIHGDGFSNFIVGISSPAPAYAKIAKKQPTMYRLDQQFERGAGIMKSVGMPHHDAVDQLKNISFHRKAAQHQKRDNIKFVI